MEDIPIVNAGLYAYDVQPDSTYSSKGKQNVPLLAVAERCVLDGVQSLVLHGSKCIVNHSPVYIKVFGKWLASGEKYWISMEACRYADNKCKAFVSCCDIVYLYVWKRLRGRGSWRSEHISHRRLVCCLTTTVSCIREELTEIVRALRFLGVFDDICRLIYITPLMMNVVQLSTRQVYYVCELDGLRFGDTHGMSYCKILKLLRIILYVRLCCITVVLREQKFIAQ